jgi:translation initiation factor 1A
MVKNIKGGSGHKKFARKFTTGAKSNNKLRISEDEGEIYAIVMKMLGNGMFHCFCMDGETRLGHIRGKFAGRGKRDNMVETGKWVLIGLREWDITSDKSSAMKCSDKKAKMQQCDLLEVYSASDKERLRDTVAEDWALLDNNDLSKSSDITGEVADILFASEKDLEREKIIQEMKSETAEKISLKVSETSLDEDDNEEVNFDDI